MLKANTYTRSENARSSFFKVITSHASHTVHYQGKYITVTKKKNIHDENLLRVKLLNDEMSTIPKRPQINYVSKYIGFTFYS